MCLNTLQHQESPGSVCQWQGRGLVFMRVFTQEEEPDPFIMCDLEKYSQILEKLGKYIASFA